MKPKPCPWEGHNRPVQMQLNQDGAWICPSCGLLMIDTRNRREEKP